VKIRKARIGFGILAAIAILGFAGMARLKGPGDVPPIMQGAELVYSGVGSTRVAGLKATDTFANLAMPWEKALSQVRNEIPTALERAGPNGPFLIVPQKKNGRVLLAEFPERAITVKAGKLAKLDGKLVVVNGTSATWSHIQVQDYRQPSVLESAFLWLGDRLGI
jgi:hypothetical protein